MAQNMVQMAVTYNKYSFCCIRMLTPFGIKTNLRENRFFAARWAVGDKMGTHHVKILTEKITAVGRLTSEQAGKRTSR